jgi:ribosomal protein S18 acetylase RimI-like enzyme
MEDLPDKNVFMMCREPRPHALAPFPTGFSVRQMGASDLPAWMAMPFDDPRDAAVHRPFMEDYVSRVYGGAMDRFFAQTMIVEQGGHMVGVCTRWKAYGALETVHWLKVKPEWEGAGVGRALMTHLLEHAEFPVYLHTQPESFRAIGLYVDLGFVLLEGERFGRRVNHLDASTSYLEQHLRPDAVQKLETVEAPEHFRRVTARADTEEF